MTSASLTTGQGALPAVDAAAGHPATVDALTFAGMSYDSPMRPEPDSVMPAQPHAEQTDGGPDWLLPLLDAVPGWVWALALGGLFAAMLVTVPLARRNARKAGERLGAKPDTSDRRARALLWASLTPAFLFWLAVLAGSARGLTAFGRDTLHWRNGWDWLVPFTLDGIAVAFGILAFRAIHARRSPDRSLRIAWTAMIASSAINFGYEKGATGSYLGGGYLAVLSLFGMLIFHEFLAQFEDGAEGEWIRRDRPKFGLRWITLLPNTLCAALAWINYPPADSPRATVAAAVAHLEQVRAGKRARRAERITASPSGWARILPWLRVAQLDAALAATRSQSEAERSERAEIAARLDAVVADFAAAEQRRAEQVAALSERLAVAEAERQAERSRAYEAEQRARALAEQVAAMRAERRQSAPKNGRRKSAEQPELDPEQKPGAPRLSDVEAVAVLLSEHPEPGYVWASREVHRLTGAGFGRIPKLLAMVAERHAERAGLNGRSNGASPAEQSA